MRFLMIMLKIHICHNLTSLHLGVCASPFAAWSPRYELSYPMQLSTVPVLSIVIDELGEDSHISEAQDDTEHLQGYLPLCGSQTRGRTQH